MADAFLEIFENDKHKLSIWDTRLLGIRFLAQTGYSCLKVVVIDSGQEARRVIEQIFEIVLIFIFLIF
jgi:hypothetical protein